MNHLLGLDRKYLAHSMHLGFVAIFNDVWQNKNREQEQ